MIHTRLMLACLMLLALAACGGGIAPGKPAPYSGLKVGKPYEIFGRQYQPSYDEHYDEIGMASWYGPGFHGGKTASGERYDQYEVTAAHRTLPLNSIVRVTNLNNGLSTLIRVNDRGPFAKNRIIDLSQGAAEKLGVIRSGTAKVRVQFLDQETRAYVQSVGGQQEFAVQEATFEGKELPEMEDDTAQLAEETPPAVVVQTHNVPGVARDLNNPGHDVFSVVDAHVAAPPVRMQDDSRQPPIPAGNPSAGGTANGGRGYFIQAGTFSQRENAENLTRRMPGSEAAETMEIMVNGRKLYRVMAGPYASQAEAKKLLSQLAAAGISDAKLIRN